jgi:hypothetical protein
VPFIRPVQPRSLNRFSPLSFSLWSSQRHDNQGKSHGKRKQLSGLLCHHRGERGIYERNFQKGLACFFRRSIARVLSHPVFVFLFAARTSLTSSHWFHVKCVPCLLSQMQNLTGFMYVRSFVFGIPLEFHSERHLCVRVWTVFVFECAVKTCTFAPRNRSHDDPVLPVPGSGSRGLSNALRARVWR